MKLVFMGTPEFAVPTLDRLASLHEIAEVVTQPDRPSGRGQKPSAPAVKQAALRLGIPVWQPESIRKPEALERLRSLAPAAIVIVGYGKIVPQSIIDLPQHGCINLHASLLPKYRGAAPVNWAIIRGETVTGVTTMKIDAGLDTGDILLKQETPIDPGEDAAALGRRLAEIGAPLVAETLRGLEAGSLQPTPQDHSLATLAPILKKEDGQIDWRWPAAEIVNRVRGLIPWPGAYSQFRGEALQIWKAIEITGDTAYPGTLVTKGGRLMARCGSGLVELLEVQQPGKRRIPASAFLNGARLREGEKLGPS